MEGLDVIACAETGTGKTAAFLVPILQRFLRRETPERSITRALILAPTRELVVQIEDQVQGLTYHTALSSIAVYGGVPMDPQERALRAGVDMVVATPGRLMDHMRHDVTNFTGIEVLVLDEADRMLDMGFWPDVQRILAALPPVRQTLLFSATIPAEVLQLTREFLHQPKLVQVGRHGGPARTISHAIQTVTKAEKVEWLAGRERVRVEPPARGVTHGTMAELPTIAGPPDTPPRTMAEMIVERPPRARSSCARGRCWSSPRRSSPWRWPSGCCSRPGRW